ncbi:MAG: GNAT family N-acetyltransferase [Bacteroidia bacterium]|nr:GNAT family N-acetyltransferase [Bacteroidia bacterium]
MTNGIQIRTDLLLADIEKIVRYHDEYYAVNYGFNHDFGRYVEGPLTEFYARNSSNERIWLLDDHTDLKGCIALARVSEDEAQLRWFYVDESLRGRGYGYELINLLIRFAVENNYQRIILWTVSLLEEARRLYEKNGFTLEEEHETKIWGRDLVEQKFTKRLFVRE